jgi:spermidine synthase
VEKGGSWHEIAVIPWQLIERVKTPGGKGEVSLHQRGQEFSIRVDGQELMSSRQHRSEEAMAELTAGALRCEAPRVLIGGLGMGFTLAAALRVLPRRAVVEVLELLPAVIAWNGGPLGELAGHPLKDERVRVREGDVRMCLSESADTFDAILLDVDNGPSALTLASNQWLYAHQGLTCIAQALRSGGLLSVWSASFDERFEKRLKGTGFALELHRVRARPSNRGAIHCVWIAKKR